ncbi:hypothetical protein K1719_044254 [Acacia pycnantha]|nr:hypothetical protein K1719_044254 [Acacia pycnantha]
MCCIFKSSLVTGNCAGGVSQAKIELGVEATPLFSLGIKGSSQRHKYCEISKSDLINGEPYKLKPCKCKRMKKASSPFSAMASSSVLSMSLPSSSSKSSTPSLTIKLPS